MIGRGRGRGRITPLGSNASIGSKSESPSPPGGLAESVSNISLNENDRNTRCVAVRSLMSVASVPMPDQLAIVARQGSIDTAPSSPSSATASPSLSSLLPMSGRFSDRKPSVPRVVPGLPNNMPRRPGFGTDGQKIKLVCNHFAVTAPETVEFHHYDFNIIEESHDGNRLLPRIEWTSHRVPKCSRDDRHKRSYEVYLAWARQFINPSFFATIYDRQRHVYSSMFLGRQRVEKVTVGRSTFEVTLKLNAEAPSITVSSAELKRLAFEDMTDRDRSPMAVLDLLHKQMMYFKQCLGKSSYVPHGRCFYTDENKVLMPMGRELKEGFSTSLRLVNGANSNLDNPGVQLTMNIDFKMSPFFKVQNLLTTVCEILRLNPDSKRPLNDREIELLRHHTRDLRVKTLHTGHIFTIESIGIHPADKEMFDGPEGKCSVAYHFERNYKTLKHPEFPCVRNVTRRWYPFEVLEVLPNQKVDLRKLTPEQSSIIIRNAAVAPNVRRQKIMEKSLELSGTDNDAFLKELGMERSREMMRLTGRVLEAPAIAYGQQKCATVSQGSWSVANQKLAFPISIENYLVVCFDTTMKPQIINDFVTALIKKARQMGVAMPEKCINGGYGKVEDFLDLVNQAKRNQTIDMAICIMSDGGLSKNRNDIKFAEKQTEVVTQCLSAKTLYKFDKNPRKSDTLFENIVLKINAKCGGLNNELMTRQDPVAAKWFTNKTMIVGMDVNHPPPLSKKEIARGDLPKKPSIVGAVANFGGRAHDYGMAAQVQDARCETITEEAMLPIMKRFLKTFAENKDDLPESIIVFRDGVSESQFAMVRNEETIAIKLACSKIRHGYAPKLTVVTVQKRHNTRFFREQMANNGARNVDQNIPAGTVVDTGPTSPFLFDFFLASQAGIQGTTKAANYVVIHDENGFLADELHRLTFLLCHVYQRATKSVSLPAPVYYAHHAATRGKELTDGYLNTSDESSSSGFSSQSDSSRSLSRSGLDFDKINAQIAYGDKFGQRALFL